MIAPAYNFSILLDSTTFKFAKVSIVLANFDNILEN